MAVYHNLRRDEELTNLREELKKKSEELDQLKGLYAQSLQFVDEQRNQLKAYAQQIESIQKEIKTLKSTYEGKINSLETELYDLKPKKPQESKPVSSEKKQKSTLYDSDAINIKNILSKYSQSPFCDEKDIIDSIKNITRKRARKYLLSSENREKIEQIILGLEEGKSILYNNIVVASDDKKRLAKFVEDEQEILKDAISSLSDGKVSASSVFNMLKIMK